MRPPTPKPPRLSASLRRSHGRGGAGCTAPGEAPEPRPNSKLAPALTVGPVGPRVVGDHADGSTPFAHLPTDEHFAWKRVNGQRSGWATMAPRSDAPSKSPHRSKLRRAHRGRAPGRCIEACHASFRLWPWSKASWRRHSLTFLGPLAWARGRLPQPPATPPSTRHPRAGGRGTHTLKRSLQSWPRHSGAGTPPGTSSPDMSTRAMGLW